ncbi:MAG: deoxyuridine 5'-triphosphate nucleotidohydrolase [Candidatus Diapherotrites archaeon]|nr:deoxyuridine 5'-triphosphate nucleotidohydrolase [Candidatus Diapherotrites archaeon]
MILTDEDIRQMIDSNPPLIDNYISLKHQLQPNGFDLTAHEIYVFETAGRIDFSNKERQFPAVKPIVFNNMWAHLDPGVYKVKTNEYLNLPKDIIAIAQTRSSLLRMGAYTLHGVWDAGFHGKSEFSLVVMNPHGIDIKQNARVAQIVFIRLDKETVEEYKGIHKGLR